MYLIEAYVTNASLNVNRAFTYYSEHEIPRYVRIRVIFHKAVNIAIVSDIKYSKKDLKEITEELGFEPEKVIDVIDEEPVISKELFELAFWLSRTTISPLISCLNSMLPKTLKTSKGYSDPKTVRKIRKINGEQHEKIY